MQMEEWAVAARARLRGPPPGAPAAPPAPGARFSGSAGRSPTAPATRGPRRPRRTRSPPRGRPTGASPKPMPTREPPRPRGHRADLQTRPPGPGPPVSRGGRRVPRLGGRGFPTLVTEGAAPAAREVENLIPAAPAATGAPRPGSQRPRAQCEPQLGAPRARPKKIVFEDELPSRALLSTRKPIEAIPREHTPRPQPVPDYELKYPQVSSERERSRYAAVFQDQYTEFLELQQEVGSALAKLQQLETLLNSLPRPRSQKEANVAARVWREFEKKQTDPSFLDKQARCHYLKGKLRHLKMQIQKFDEQGDCEGLVYF